MRDKDLYRSVPVNSYSLGDSTEILTSPRTAPIEIPTYLSLALRACTAARSLEEHERVIRSVLTVNGCAPEILSGLLKVGILVRLNSVVRRPALPPRAPSNIEIIAIPTRSRPAELERAIRSYWTNCAAFGHSPRFLVADDSANGSSDATRHLCDTLRRSLSLRICYAGSAEKRRYAALLARASGVSLATINFALFGIGGLTIGANRNSILLHTSGTKVLSVDDDTICRTARSPEQSRAQQLILGLDGDVTDFWFCDSSDGIDMVARWDEIDVVGAHQRVLGEQLATLCGEWDEELLNIAHACSHIWSMLCRDAGRVCVSYNGVAGDSGMYSVWLPHTCPSPGTKHRLASSQQVLETSVRSRYVLRHAPSLVIGHADPCIGMCIGLDNRQILPPFFPVGRNEDGLFGWSLDTCVSGACAAHLPWSIEHLPPGARTYTTSHLRRSRISDIMISCMTAWPGSSTSKTTEYALRSLGLWLGDLATLSPRALHEIIRHNLWRMASAKIARGEALLAGDRDLPEYWTERVREQNDEIRAGMLAPEFTVPIDLACSQEDAPSRVRDVMSKFSELLCAWPSIFQASIDLRKRGIELGVEL